MLLLSDRNLLGVELEVRLVPTYTDPNRGYISYRCGEENKRTIQGFTVSQRSMLVMTVPGSLLASVARNVEGKGIVVIGIYQSTHSELHSLSAVSSFQQR